MVWVNKRGERFADETGALPYAFQSANAVYRQPSTTSYALFDEKIKQGILGEGLDPKEKYAKGESASAAWPDSVDKDLHLQMKKGKVKISNSWDKIARWIEATPEALKHTIDEYNSFCDQGYDEMFVKEPRYLLPLRTPPYYVIQCCLNLITTRGGIKVNHHMEVLNHQENPISGLYAAGVETGGTDGDTYDGANLPGHSFGFTLSSGRIAGENAARYILGDG